MEYKPKLKKFRFAIFIVFLLLISLPACSIHGSDFDKLNPPPAG